MQSSFRHFSGQSNAPPGVKLNRFYQISSGIQSLDDLLGGGIFLGTITMIKQDRWSDYTLLVLKYFLAQGASCGHQGLIISLDSDPNEIKNGLMGLTKSKKSETVNHRDIRTSTRQLGELRNDQMKIAWRYQNLGTVSNDFYQNAPVDELYCSTFDLTKKFDSKDTFIKTIGEVDLLNETCKDYGIFTSLLQVIKEELESLKSIQKDSPKSVLRIAIDSFGSFLWPDMNADELMDKNNQKMVRFSVNISLAFNFFMLSRVFLGLIMQLFYSQFLLIYIMILFMFPLIL